MFDNDDNIIFLWINKKNNYPGQDVQSIVSLTSLLVVKMLTVLFNDQSFINDTLTNKIVGFEQLGPGCPSYLHCR